MIKKTYYRFEYKGSIDIILDGKADDKNKELAMTLALDELSHVDEINLIDIGWVDEHEQ